MESNYSSSSSDEEAETPEEVEDPTHMEVTPPAAPAQDLGFINTPNKSLAVPKIKDVTENCVSPASPKSRNEEAYKCPICFDFVSDWEPMTTPCGHVFCKDCINSAILRARRCPLCKRKVRLHNLLRIFM